MVIGKFDLEFMVNHFIYGPIKNRGSIDYLYCVLFIKMLIFVKVLTCNEGIRKWCFSEIGGTGRLICRYEGSGKNT